ncbi:MAG TPA: DNA polymerase III subunit delta [Solirubrobacterales bacterium]|nr:DNA polymerase III subunit delta [Solirubrobacterales bacterium]
MSSRVSSASREPGAIKPAYLIAGTDSGKIDAALARLRERAEREGGPGALESFAPPGGEGPPSADALVAAMPLMSLAASHRYLLADGVERWSAKQTGTVIAALGDLPPDVTVVLVAREAPPRTRAPKGLAEAIEGAGGEVVRYAAPSGRELPARLVAEAGERGFELDSNAARLLVERMGESTLRLANELDRLALWAGEGQAVTADDLASMVADTSEEAAWSLSDAIVAGEPGAAILAAESLAAQGEAVTPLVYQAAKRLREAHAALTELDAGVAPKEVEAKLRMHPYAARMLIRRVRGGSAESLRSATCALADLEWWTRGGSDFPDDVALTLTVRRAAGAGAGAG